MRIPCCLLVVLSLAGCGDDGYRADLANNTVPYFDQRYELDTTLSAPWEKAGISLRVPKTFTEQPAPAPPTKEQKEDESWEPPPDKRQPDYFEGRLPGLKGAWQGPLPSAGQKAGNRWLYVLDTLALEDDPVEPGLDPERYVDEIADRFARALNLQTPDVERFKWTSFPQTQQPFAPPVRYRVPPAPLVEEFGEGVEHQVELYVHEGRGRTVILALVMPQDLILAPEMSASRDLMLQTLSVNTPAPAAGSPNAGGAAF